MVDDDLKGLMSETGKDVLHGSEQVSSVRGIAKVDVEVVPLNSAVRLARGKTRVIREEDVMKTTGRMDELVEGVCQCAGGWGFAKLNGAAVDENGVFKASILDELAKVEADERGRGVEIDDGARVLIVFVNLVGLKFPPSLPVDEPSVTIGIKKPGFANVVERLDTEGAFRMRGVV